MVIVAKVSFPRSQLNQAVAVYMGLPPVPSGVRLSGPFFRPDSETVHAVAVYHLESDSQPEILALVRDRYRGFKGIPGFTKDIQEWHEFREMLAAWFN
jgi:hypothetical protein